jgi:myosin I
VFQLEERREQRLYSYAVKIQEFFNLYIGSNNYFFQIRVEGNELVKNKKERRRLSLERAYRADYIDFKDNTTLHVCTQRASERERERERGLCQVS